MSGPAGSVPGVEREGPGPERDEMPREGETRVEFVERTTGRRPAATPESEVGEAEVPPDFRVPPAPRRE